MNWGFRLTIMQTNGIICFLFTLYEITLKGVSYVADKFILYIFVAYFLTTETIMIYTNFTISASNVM